MVQAGKAKRSLTNTTSGNRHPNDTESESNGLSAYLDILTDPTDVNNSDYVNYLNHCITWTCKEVFITIPDESGSKTKDETACSGRIDGRNCPKCRVRVNYKISGPTKRHFTNCCELRNFIVEQSKYPWNCSKCGKIIKTETEYQTHSAKCTIWVRQLLFCSLKQLCKF